MLEQLEREIKMSTSAVPTRRTRTPPGLSSTLPPSIWLGAVPRADVGACHGTWNTLARRAGIFFWCDTLDLKMLGDLHDILPKVAERYAGHWLDIGNCGKAAANKALNLRSMILWCKKRKHLSEDPLEELTKFHAGHDNLRSGA